MPAHEASCPLVPVACQHCKRTVRRSGLHAHLLACDDAIVECELCHGLFKRRAYPLHVSALCEENVLTCGKCSGTYKRKYKQYHDCVRHLQNCLKTMDEEVATLKKRLSDKDKQIVNLETRVYYELADIRAQLAERSL